MSAANRNRGARAEVAVVNYLRQHGYEDARRYLAGDGRQPGDIDFHPLVCLEVKDVASSAWPSWCRQAAAEAREGMVPVVVRRTRGVPDVGLWECRCRFWFGGWKEATELPATALPGEGRALVAVDAWVKVPFASFVAALSRFDAIDQGLPAVRTYAGDS